MEELINAACRLGIDAGHLCEIAERSALNCFERAEVMQQRALARRTDAGDLLQPGLADVFLASLSVRTDGEAVGLVAQALDEIEQRIARFELNRCASGDEKRFPPGLPLRPFGDRDQR